MKRLSTIAFYTFLIFCAVVAMLLWLEPRKPSQDVRTTETWTYAAQWSPAPHIPRTWPQVIVKK